MARAHQLRLPLVEASTAGSNLDKGWNPFGTVSACPLALVPLLVAAFSEIAPPCQVLLGLASQAMVLVRLPSSPPASRLAAPHVHLEVSTQMGNPVY